MSNSTNGDTMVGDPAQGGQLCRGNAGPPGEAPKAPCSQSGPDEMIHDLVVNSRARLAR